MDNKNISIVKNSMNYGAMTGLALFIIFILFNFIGITKSAIHQIIGYGVLIGGIILGTKYFRDNVLHGTISYGKALASGTWIAFFCSILLAFFMYLFLLFIDPSMLDIILQEQEKQLIQKGLSDDQIEMAMHYTRKFTTPTMFALMSVLTYTFLGFIFSLITSAFLKKAGPSSFDNFIEKNLE